MHDVEDPIYDPVSAQSHEDPYPAYARLREEFPLYYITRHDVWALSRYADVRDGLRNWETFSSAQGVELGTYVQFFGEGSIQELDPPHHDVLRKVLAPRFMNRRIKDYEPMVEACAAELLDALAGRDVVDIGTEFTQRLPILTIFRIIGIPDDDIGWAMTAGLEMLSRPPGEEGPSALAYARRAELVDFMVAQVHHRLRDGITDDVLGDIAVAIRDGVMKEEEIQGLTLLLIAAGMETTTSLMGNIANAVASGVVSADELLGDRGEMAVPAIDEFLRHDSPAQWLARVTTQPVALHGVDLPIGSRVLMIFASANRDPRVFDRADELVLDRSGERMMSFGEGVHFCVGMPLAKVEARIGMSALLRRYPGMSAAGPVVRYPSHVIRGYEHIPVSLVG